MSASVILLISACIYLAVGVPVAFALGLSTVTHPMAPYRLDLASGVLTGLDLAPATGAVWQPPRVRTDVRRTT